jgi:hypothetical protein
VCVQQLGGVVLPPPPNKMCMKSSPFQSRGAPAPRLCRQTCRWCAATTRRPPRRCQTLRGGARVKGVAHVVEERTSSTSLCGSARAQACGAWQLTKHPHVHASDPSTHRQHTHKNARAPWRAPAGKASQKSCMSAADSVKLAGRWREGGGKVAGRWREGGGRWKAGGWKEGVEGGVMHNPKTQTHEASKHMQTY